jgi:hypothetical protein
MPSPALFIRRAIRVPSRYRHHYRVILLISRQLLARAQLNAAWLANRGWVNLVRRTGGKIKPHHNAFFMAADGSQMGDAYITSDLRVGLVTEYADVSPNFSSVALVHGSDPIQGVAISAADAAAQPGAAAQTTADARRGGRGRTDSTNRILGRNPCFPRQRRQLPSATSTKASRTLKEGKARASRNEQM